MATITAGNKIHITGVGQTTITASQPADLIYNAASATQVFIVNPATLTIKANNQTKVYGVANPPLVFVYTGFVYGESSAVVTTGPTISTTALINSPVGAYPITGSGASAANYVFAFTPGVLTITPAPLLITPDDKTRIYGVANPALTAKYTGFITGDDASKLTTAPTISTTATIASAVGTIQLRHRARSAQIIPSLTALTVL